MSWREKLQGKSAIPKASFRGQAFHVETMERSGGRRTVSHEYPQRDQPFVEDMGLKARTFPVEGYVIGDDYLTARDNLLTALEDAGTGELIHPYYGTRRVIPTDYRVRESATEGGIARFSITFAETPAQPAIPTTVDDLAGVVAGSAASARVASAAEFLDKYVVGVTSEDSIVTLLSNATHEIEKQVSKINAGVQQVALLTRTVSDFKQSIGNLVNAPGNMVAGFEKLFALFDNRPPLLALYAFVPGLRPPGTGVNGLQDQANFDATHRMIQRLAVTRSAEIIKGETFTSYDDAVSARAGITDKLDEQSDVAADDTYPALLQLRSDLVNGIPGSGSDLPRLVQFIPQASIPSLVLAHRLYGNLDLEQDLIDRNKIKNPGFIPGGTALEVLSGT